MNGPQDVGGRHGFGRSCRRMRASGSTPNGKSACSASRSPPPRWATGTSTRPATPAKACLRDLLQRQLLRDLAARVGGAAPACRRGFGGGTRRRAGRSRPVSAPTAGCRRVRFRRFWPKAARPNAPAPPPASASATASARAITSRRVTPGCPDTRGAGRGSSPRCHGCHVYPDTNAHFEGEQPCPFTPSGSTRRSFSAPDADPTLTVSIDAWEPYLESA
jgi:hypothetical protein